MGEPLFPILDSAVAGYNAVHEWRRKGCVAVVGGIPWRLILPHEAQAKENHDQTLRRLAARGGLSHCEAVAILEDRPWRKMDDAEANNRLLAIIMDNHPTQASAETDAGGERT